MDPVNVTLRKPILAHGKTVDALTIAPLTAKELRSCGFPFRTIYGADGTRGEDWNGPVLSSLIGTLAQIPTSSVDMMDPRDWRDCVFAISGFFADTSPTISSGSPGDSAEISPAATSGA